MNSGPSTAETPVAPQPGAVIPHQATLKQRALARLIYWVVRAFTATIRFRWGRLPSPLTADGRPYIFCVWHNRLPLSLIMYQKWAAQAGAPLRLAAIVSASRDGAMMSHVLKLFGVEPARGSSSRRGLQAMLDLAEWARRGYDVALASDGPRGPIYEMKPGVVALAQMTGRPIVLASYHLTRKITLRSWDRFQIPLPFSTCTLRLGDPVHVPRSFRDEERARVCAEVEAELRRLTVD